MKKIFTFLTIFTLAISMLTACGSNEKEIKEALRGTWGYDVYATALGEKCHQIYKFSNDDTVEAAWINDDASSKNSFHMGTYKIEKDKIVITYPDREDITIEYSYNNGNLKLFDKGDGSLDNELHKD